VSLAEDRKWLQAENEFWTGAQRKSGDRRGFLWLLIGVVVLALARLVGCPGSVFT
jgi:hypothetical protein